MPVPLLAGVLAGGAASTIGSFLGGSGQQKRIQQGMDAYKRLSDQGIKTLEGGKQGANAAFDPYTQAGQTGVAGATSATQNYLQNAQAGMPDLSQTKTTAQGTQAFLDPSAAYSTDQANRATQASALAKGGMGGGLARALSNNANKMAQTNWNNAAQQQLAANQANYGQSNQNWQNNFQTQNQNVGNWQNLANMGLSATGQNQNLQAGYNQGINQNYVGQADNQMSGYGAQGQVFNNTATALGKNISGMVGSIFGGK